MPIKVVFVCLLAGGHLQVPIALGKSLLFRDPENEIYFVCDEKHHKKLKGKCAQFKTLIYGSSTFELTDEMRKKKLNVWMMENRERFKNVVKDFGFKLVEMWESRAKIIQNLIDQVEPDLVIIENLFNLPFIMTMKYKWAIIVSTNPLKIANHIEINCPPIGSGVNHDFEWYIEVLKEYGADFRNKLDEWYKQYGIERKPSLSYIQPSPYFNVCLYPKMLNYFNPETEIDGKWLQLSSTILKDEINKFIKDQNWVTEKIVGKDELLTDEFLKKPGKLILLSMGTFVSDNAEIFDKFILPAIANCSHKFIISCGSSFDKIKLPDNCVGANDLNQLELLSLEELDLFITHGGNNSFTEALYFGKPMIVIPAMGDQHDNAARLEHFGFGKRIYLQNISTEELSKAIDYVTNNKEIKAKLNEISKIIQKDDSMDKLTDLVIETCSKK